MKSARSAVLSAVTQGVRCDSHPLIFITLGSRAVVDVATEDS